MKKQFYEKALPSQGMYCAVGIKNGKVTHHFAEQLDQLVTQVETLHDENYNVYVAPNTFEGFSRKANYAKFSRSFFVDLDVGKDNQYVSQAEAVDALGAFVSAQQLPDPVVLNSGTGIQAYWLFDSDIAITEWQPYAENFKALCIANGLKIDPTVTADAARIMRCPDTFNYKTTPPSKTSVLTDIADVYTYDFAEFKSFLDEIHGSVIGITNTAKTVLDSVEKGLDEDTAAFKNIESSFSDLVCKSLADEGCAQIKNIIVNAATLNYDLWVAGLSIAGRCVDAETAIHDMSDSHPNYNREATEAKAKAEWKGPRTCAWFIAHYPAHCEGCKFKDQITSPIELSKQLQALPYAEEAPQEDSVRVEEDPKTVPLFPKFLYPFSRGKDGGIYYTGSGDEDDDEETIVKILTHDFFPIRRVVGGPDGELLEMRQIKPKDDPVDISLPMKHIGSLSELTKIMGSIGEIIENQAQARLLVKYLKKWAEYLQIKEAAEIMRMQMGWTEKKDVFIVGRVEILPDGKERTSAVSPMIRGTQKLFTREGSLDEWKRVITVFNKPEFEVHAFAGPLAGFAAPLMHLTGSPGGTIGLTSAGTGHGKSATLYSALSIWGHPKQQSIVEGSGSTQLGLMNRFTTLKNLPLGLDETGNIDPTALSYMIHQISQGNGKIRLQSSIDAERELKLPASTLAILTGNRDYYSILTSNKEITAGEMARLIQLHLRRPAHWEDADVGRKEMGILLTNYGWAGPEFIKQVYKIGETQTRVILDYWMDKFMKDFSKSVAYRFYGDILSACMASGQIANDAKLLDFDLERIYRGVLIDMIQMRDKVMKLDHVDYKQILTQFYYKNIDRFLILNESRVVQEPRGELVGRIEEDQGIYILSSAFTKFLADKHISDNEFRKALEKDGIYKGVKKIRLSSGWKTGTGATPPVNALMFVPEILTEMQKKDDEAK
jgi:hypothetical protein